MNFPRVTSPLKVPAKEETSSGISRQVINFFGSSQSWARDHRLARTHLSICRVRFQKAKEWYCWPGDSNNIIVCLAWDRKRCIAMTETQTSPNRGDFQLCGVATSWRTLTGETCWNERCSSLGKAPAYWDVIKWFGKRKGPNWMWNSEKSSQFGSKGC